MFEDITFRNNEHRRATRTSHRLINKYQELKNSLKFINLHQKLKPKLKGNHNIDHRRRRKFYN